MPTLLQINTVVNKGSTGRIAEEIGQTAIKNGWVSYIAYGRYERHSKSKLIKIGRDFDVKLHGIKTRLFDQHGFGSKSATKKLIYQIEKIKPDIIHLHNLHGYYLNIKILFSYLAKADIPIVWTLHDCWPITGHCSHFEFVGCDKWKTLCYKCPQKKEYPASYFIDRSELNFQQKKGLFTSVSSLILVPVSNWLANILKESFLRDIPVKLIHNGINTEIFQPTFDQTIHSKYKLNGKFIILGVANVWSSRKGLKDFVEVGKRLSSDFQIILVGLTKKQIKNLSQNIVGIEKTENVHQLAELYTASDIFLNPTYEDNFPTTNLESMACGTPIITYKTGGSPEAINNSTGIVVEKGNINGLIAAIKQIKEKGKMFYTDACIKRANQLFKKEDRFQEYLDLYESLFSKQ